MFEQKKGERRKIRKKENGNETRRDVWVVC